MPTAGRDEITIGTVLRWIVLFPLIVPVALFWSTAWLLERAHLRWVGNSTLVVGDWFLILWATLISAGKD